MRTVSPDPKTVDEEELLGELLREAERAVDYQVRAFERADSRAERMIGLSAGALVAGWGAASAVGGQGLGSAPWGFSALVGLGSVALLCSLGLFVRGYLGLREPSAVRFGPTPEWLLAEAGEGTHSLATHRRRALGAHADNHIENLASLYGAGAARKSGVQFLLGGVLFFALAMFYIRGG